MVCVILLFILHSLDSFLNRITTSSGPRREHQCLPPAITWRLALMAKSKGFSSWPSVMARLFKKSSFPTVRCLFEGLAEGGQGKRMREKREETGICIQCRLLLEIYAQTSLTFAITDILSKGTKPDTTVVKIHRPWGPRAESGYTLDVKMLVATTQLTLSITLV